MTSKENYIKEKCELHKEVVQPKKEQQHRADNMPSLPFNMTAIKKALPEILKNDQNVGNIISTQKCSKTEQSGLKGAIQTEEILGSKLAHLVITESKQNINTTPHKLPSEPEKLASGKYNPFKKLNYRLDTHKTYRDSLRSYAKSANLDIRPRRRLCHTRGQGVVPVVGGFLPSSYGKHPTALFISKIEKPVTTNLHGLWNLRKSLMVKKLSAKGLADSNQKSDHLPQSEKREVTAVNNILPLNCFEENSFTEGLSYQEVAQMPNQRNEETDSSFENPAWLTNTQPFKENIHNMEEDTICGNWFKNDIKNKGRKHRTSSPSLLNSNTSEVPFISDEVENNPAQAKERWNRVKENDSIPRIIDWDPWAGLNRMAEDVPVHLLTGTHSDNEPMDTSHEMGKNITIIHSTPAVPIWPILKSHMNSETDNDTQSTFATIEQRGSPLQQGGDGSLRNVKSDKRVQWNQDVQVIYFAGDTDGGNVVGTEIEPLRDEEDQQSRAKQYAREYTRRFFNRTRNFPFIDPWFPIL